jgi:hypothetical protein
MIDDPTPDVAIAKPPKGKVARDAKSPSTTAQEQAKAEARAATQRQTRKSALEPGEQRDKLYEDHPVTKNEVAIATPPLKEAYDTVQDVVVHREPGTCMLGDFRAGKTTTIVRTVRQLNQTFPTLPVGIAFAKGHDGFTQGTFFSDLLQDFNHAGALRGTTQEKRTRCLNMLIGQARQLSSDRYLLVVDEGQNWGEPQWTWLRDLANDLANKQIRLITVTFGQTADLRKLRLLLISRSRTDLVGRFLLNPREFRGLRDVEELRVTLEAYDDPEQSAYPIGTDISYSEFFMPLAFKGGWRLADEADRMWDEFRKVAQRGGKVASNIGMNWIGGAVRNFLFSECMKDGPGYAGTSDIWGGAVQASGYEATLF